uniref:Uncharacterized protein n=1 Tax=Siphoviridae sp. ctiJm4 TaxID=2827916 RepID=A0A8S5T1C1_9CAUD|nr:MAG TPA: hypothetical protein [Siphoviridae sp. ctiJm4]
MYGVKHNPALVQKRGLTKISPFLLYVFHDIMS